MAIDKITPRQLNKDEDSLLLRSVEMSDALNVRISEDEEGNRGVLKNIKGNSALLLDAADSLPSGTNRVVGSCSFNQKNEVYYFVWNSNATHTIYRINESGAKLITAGSYLEFDKTSIVNAQAIEDGNGEILLYFNDGVNEPKKVNVTKCLDANITYPAGITNADRLIEVAVAKQPPLQPVTFEYKTNTSVKSNYVYGKMFQFAYQYIYRDGEVSALSPISSPAFSNWMANRARTLPREINSENYLRLTFKTSTAAVEKVRVLARTNNVDTFAIVKEVDVVTPGSDLTYDFYNDGLYPLLATNESDKTHDVVPKKAQSMTLSNNRLFFGNYTEGFDVSTPTTSLEPFYMHTGAVRDFDITKSAAVQFHIDTSSLESEIPGNKKLSVRIQVNYTRWSYGNQGGVSDSFTVYNSSGSSYDYTATLIEVVPGAPVFEFDINLTAASYTKTDYINAIKSALEAAANVTVNAAQYSTVSSLVELTSTVGDPGSTSLNAAFGGSMVFGIENVSYDSVDDELDFQVKLQSYDLRASYVQGITLSTAENITDSFTASETPGILYGTIGDSFVYEPLAQASVSTFKSNADHGFGIVYYDNRGRATGVREIGSVSVSGWGAEDRDGRNGAAKIIVDISSDAPSYAASYSIVYSKNNKYSDYKQYTVMEAFKATNADSNDVGDSDGNDNIYVSLASLQRKEDSYSASKASGFKFSAAEGDKLRIVRYYDRTAGEYVYPQGFEFEVIGLKTFTATDSPIYHNHSSSGGDHERNEYRVSGDFLVLKNESHLGFSSGLLSDSETNGSSYWQDGVLVELYTPLKTVEKKIYYEIGANQLINANGKHVGSLETDDTYKTYSVIEKTATALTLDTPYPPTVGLGDSITIAGSARQITDIQYNDGSITLVFANENFSALTISAITYRSNKTRLVLESGDAYIVPKELRYYDTSVAFDPQIFSNKKYFIGLVEAGELSDYFDSNVFSYGKPYAIIENEKEVTRKASVTYSDIYNQSSSRLTLSSFTPANIPFYDFDVSKGGIYGLVDMKNYIMALQEDSVMKIPVGANILDTASGDNIPTISTNVLARPIEYQGIFGINTQRDAFIHIDGAVYLCDMYRGKVFRVTSESVAEVSANGMSSYFNKQFSAFKNFAVGGNKVFLKLGFDRENNEFILSAVKYTAAGAAFSDQFTVGYHIKRDIWTSFYSFVGESYAELNNVMYSFKGGQPWAHEASSSRNQFYGTNYKSLVEISSNQNPSMVKAYTALNIEGDAPWDFTAYTSDQETSKVTSMSKREKLYYAPIPRDASSNSTSEFMTLGTVVSINQDDSVTVSNPINKIPFGFNDSVYANGVDTSEVMTALVTRNSFYMSDSSVLSVGDVVSVKKNSDLEGDQLKDRYLKLILEKTTTDPVELFGVGFIFDRSKVHNDLVN